MLLKSDNDYEKLMMTFNDLVLENWLQLTQCVCFVDLNVVSDMQCYSVICKADIIKVCQ